jgi:hypothetical protein
MNQIVRAALAGALLFLPAASGAQAPPPAAPEGAAAAAGDCSRWPASVYETASAACVCPQGMWWNLRGDACLPREHAAKEFCSTVGPGSDPYFTAGGGYRCVCAPPLLWNAEATACRAPYTTGDDDCTTEWPGTLPVLAPSGVEFECRCPGGRRWDETTRSCVPGAPPVASLHGFFPQQAPDADAPVAPRPGGPGGAGPDRGAYPGEGGGAPTPPVPGDGNAGGPGAVPAAIPRVPPAPTGECESLLSDIKGRAAAGRSDEADALGMKAAIAGCDPAAIAEAVRAPKPGAR